jgi:type IV pilus assembly protein PilM
MIVGLDIGRQYVKSVLLEKIRSGYKLHNAGARLVLDPNRAYDPEEINPPMWVIAVKELLRQQRVNPRRVRNLVTGINGSNVSIKQITTLEMPSDELYSAMTFEARKHIPMDGSDAVLDFQIFGPNQKEVDKIDVGLVACTKRIMSHHLELLKEIGFKPGVVDADPIALTNAYTYLHDWPEEGVVVLFDIGAVSSTLVVWGRKDPYLTRDIPIGTHHFVKWIAEHRSLDYVTAQDELWRRGVACAAADETQAGSTGVQAITVAERTIFDNLVEDIRRTLRYYAKTTNQSFFLKIYLSGGGSATPGLATFIQERLNVEVGTLNPLEEFQGIDKLELPVPAQFTVAAGLALRGCLPQS